MAGITITPLAFESLGVRSMCTLVRTRDVTVMLDAGVALGPRFRLMPHPKEFRARDEARERINAAAGKAKVVTISHYHNDHHTPNYLDPVWLGCTPELSEQTYRGKIVLAKDFRKKINTAQRRRGWMFKQVAEKWAEKFETADGRIFKFGKTTIRFPEPVPHGEDESGLGWVLLCVVEKGDERLVFAPDVQGPVQDDTVEIILDAKPTVLILGGPPTYLQGFRIGEEFFQTAIHNMERIVSQVETVVVDHHLLRDAGWHKFLEPVRESANRNNHQLLTAADLLKEEPYPLECRRKELYDEEKPSEAFLKWAKLPKEKLNETPPPL
jgi:predicted metallo-beta-lactamase superfamily hydrolase